MTSPTSTQKRILHNGHWVAHSRLVLADDHPLYRDGLARALRATGRYDIAAQTSTGAQALRAIEATSPDLAVLDVRMPDLGGLDVLRRLRAHHDATAVVLLSAFNDQELKDAARIAGAAAYLTKDLDRLELIEQLDQVVAHLRSDDRPRPPRHTSDGPSPLLPAPPDANAVSWKVLGPGVDVFSADHQRIGVVQFVLADEPLDLFEGIVIDTKLGPGGLRYADLDQVAAILEDHVELRIPAAEVKGLPTPPSTPAVMAYHATDEPANTLRQALGRGWDLISGRR